MNNAMTTSNAHAYIHAYIHACIHTYTHIHTYYIHACMRACTLHTHAHTYTHICIHAYIHTYTHMRTHVHTYIHIYMYTYIHTYTHMYIHHDSQLHLPLPLSSPFNLTGSVVCVWINTESSPPSHPTNLRWSLASGSWVLVASYRCWRTGKTLATWNERGVYSRWRQRLAESYTELHRDI